MATYYANQHPNPAEYATQEGLVSAALTSGRLRCKFASFSVVGATHLAGDKISIGKVSAHDVFVPLSYVDYGPITGASDVNIGTAADPDIVADGLDLSAGNNKKLFNGGGALLPRNLAQPIWQALGLSEAPEDPMIELFIELVTNPTGDGDLCVTLITSHE